tara:strand:+ start:433 stop:951 length:519 start_codon:yes stop_codon:yes gene_type:complete
MIYNLKLQTLDIQKEVCDELLNIYGWCQKNNFYSSEIVTNGLITWNVLNFKEQGKFKFDYIKKVLQNILPVNREVYKLKYMATTENGCFTKRMYKLKEEYSFILKLRGDKVTIDFNPFEKIDLKINEMAFFSSDLEHSLEPVNKDTILVIGGMDERDDKAYKKYPGLRVPKM